MHESWLLGFFVLGEVTSTEQELLENFDRDRRVHVLGEADSFETAQRRLLLLLSVFVIFVS